MAQAGSKGSGESGDPEEDLKLAPFEDRLRQVSVSWVPRGREDSELDDSLCCAAV